LLIEKGIFTKDEFLDMAKVIDREMKRKKKGEAREGGQNTPAYCHF